MITGISSFFNRFSSSAVHSAWNNLITLPHVKKAALVAVSFFVSYKLYRSYLLFEPLTNRVKKPEERKSSSLGENTKEPLSRISTPTKAAPLELFQAQFLGNDIESKHPNSEVLYLMKTIFRIEEVSSCTFDPPTCTFTLSYENHKTIVLNKLPQIILNKMSFIERWFVVPVFLKTEPKIQISQKIEAKFTPIGNGKGREITFMNKEAVFLMPNKWRHTAYLKSILIPCEAEKEFSIEVEYNSMKIQENIGSQLFVETFDCIFPH